MLVGAMKMASLVFLESKMLLYLVKFIVARILPFKKFLRAVTTHSFFLIIILTERKKRMLLFRMTM